MKEDKGEYAITVFVDYHAPEDWDAEEVRDQIKNSINSIEGMNVRFVQSNIQPDPMCEDLPTDDPIY